MPWFRQLLDEASFSATEAQLVAEFMEHGHLRFPVELPDERINTLDLLQPTLLNLVGHLYLRPMSALGHALGELRGPRTVGTSVRTSPPHWCAAALIPPAVPVAVDVWAGTRGLPDLNPRRRPEIPAAPSEPMGALVTRHGGWPRSRQMVEPGEVMIIASGVYFDIVDRGPQPTVIYFAASDAIAYRPPSADDDVTPFPDHPAVSAFTSAPVATWREPVDPAPVTRAQDRRRRKSP